MPSDGIDVLVLAGSTNATQERRRGLEIVQALRRGGSVPSCELLGMPPRVQTRQVDVERHPRGQVQEHGVATDVAGS